MAMIAETKNKKLKQMTPWNIPFKFKKKKKFDQVIILYPSA